MLLACLPPCCIGSNDNVVVTALLSASCTSEPPIVFVLQLLIYFPTMETVRMLFYRNEVILALLKSMFVCHIDDFASGWYLSARRCPQVLHVLIDCSAASAKLS